MKNFQWEHLLQEVSNKIPSQPFKAWVEPVRFLELNDKFLVLGVNTQFSKDWIYDHYRDIFKQALKDIYSLTLEIKIEIRASEQEDLLTAAFDSSALLTLNPSSQSDKISKVDEDITFEEAPAENTSLEPLTPLSVKDLVGPVVKTQGQPLDPKQTFDTFIVGASNQFAHAAARAVAEQPASQYNPLFLYSEAGLGKTHLLHAIGNYYLKNNPKAKICYISAEKFVNDLIESIQNSKMTQFREKYRDSYDILLMDDIQFIANKDRTQEEFFHTFNALHSSKRQIVVTSDKPPKEISGLEERIRTRFEWGLIADIDPPEIETRIAILRAKAEIDDIYLPNEVALFLASNIKTNIRELEGSLIRIGAQASLTGSEISLDLAKQILRDMIKEPNNTVSVDLILDAVAKYFSLKVLDLKSKERSRRVAQPRQIAMYLIRKYTSKSFPDIGNILGGKDHSTAVHGVKMISQEIEKNLDLKRTVEEIQNLL